MLLLFQLLCCMKAYMKCHKRITCTHLIAIALVNTLACQFRLTKNKCHVQITASSQFFIFCFVHCQLEKNAMVRSRTFCVFLLFCRMHKTYRYFLWFNLFGWSANTINIVEHVQVHVPARPYSVRIQLNRKDILLRL